MELRGCLSVDELALLAAGSGDHVALATHVDSCETCRSAIAAMMRAARAIDPQTGSEIGRYVVRELLGAGGMGRVYVAFDPELARTIALKLLRSAASTNEAEAMARLAREAQLTAQLAHPNVVAVYDIGRHGTQVYVAMELVVGQTLRAWCRTPRTWREIVDAFVQAGRGIAAAHAAGMIHRDIKPDNILVGEDGRVRISDFGLARGATDVTTSESLDSTIDTLTRTGAVLGTIPYMAPEQLDGGLSDERSDQFSFCVTLYEALSGARPFVGSKVAELKAAMLREPPPLKTEAPRSVRAAIVRGLARDPAARFASMDALLAVLGADLHARRRRLMIGGGLVAAVAVTASLPLAHAADPCSDGPREIATVWNAAVAAELAGAWHATTIPNAAATWDRVRPALDHYADRWRSGAREACRATRIDRHQSEAVLELRTVCLDRRKQELAAVVAALHVETPDVVEHAVAVVDAMSSIAQCDDLDALRAPVPPPRDLATRLGVTMLESQLRDTEVATRTARLAGLDHLVVAQVDRTVALGYAPLIAEAWTARADVATALGDARTAESALYEALWAAQAGRDTRAVVVAWTKLLAVVGVEQAHHEEGERMVHHADAALRGLGEDRKLRMELELVSAKLYRDRGDFTHATAALDRARAATTPEDQRDIAAIEHTTGTVAFQLGRYDEALASYQRAHDLLEHALGPQHPDVARALMDLGNIAKDRADYAGALAIYQHAEQLLRASVPPMHPTLGAVEGNIGLTLMEQRKFDEALEHQHMALDILEQAHGHDHPEVGKELNNIALTLEYAKRAAEALPYLERARALFIASEGPDHFDVAMTEHNLGLAYQQLRDYPASETHFRASIAIRQKVAPQHPELARSMAALAAVMTISERYPQAAELLIAAIAIEDKAWGPTNPQLAKPLLDLGWIQNRRGEHAAAIAPLERVVEIHRATKDPLIAVSRFELANALWEAKRDRPRALELARLARADIDPKATDDLAEIDTWLAKHKL